MMGETPVVQKYRTGWLRSCPDTGSVIYSHAPDQQEWFGMGPLERQRKKKRVI